MLLPNFIALQANVEQIKDKIDTAPDKGYEIGVAIGTFLPLVVIGCLSVLDV
jgi:hypothetical protein